MTSTLAIPAYSQDETATAPQSVSRKWLVFWFIVVAVMYALLWSPHWYPLSDSSLYLSLGRSVAAGRGLTMMGDPVRLCPPLTPLLIAGIIKLGGGMGAIQAVMIALMLVSHVLCFLTLSRWTNQRLALAATLAGAFSYWVYANCFTIMSEPLCLVFLWSGFLMLTCIRIDSPRRWLLVIVSALCLVLAAANRDAVLVLLPGPLLALFMRVRTGRWWAREQVMWAVVFGLTISVWFVYRYPPKVLAFVFNAPTTKPTTATTQQAPALPITPEHEDESGPREGRYRTAWMGGIDRDWHMVTEPPVYGGRWVSEGMVMATLAVFESRNNLVKVVATTIALTAFALAILGGGLMLRRGHWWVFGVAFYFCFIWLQWGDRIKPRYMVPIAPMLFMFVWYALTWIVASLASLRKGTALTMHNVGNAMMTCIVSLIFLGNLFPWGVEFYIRHVSKRDFYDIARRGAYAQLVDIGAYAQKHIPGDVVLFTNAGAHRRIDYILTGHKIQTSEITIVDWADWDKLLEENKGNVSDDVRRKRGSPLQRRKRFFRGIAQNARYIIILVQDPAPGYLGWPGWHLPIRPESANVEWWRLYQKQKDGSWKQVQVPRSRDYVRGIPPAAK